MTKVLGKGLGALIRNYNANIESEEFNAKLSLSKIIPNKNQPRKYFNPKELNSLINSIKEKGIIQPLTVRSIGDNNFEIIAGERRFKAAKKLKLNSVPAYILNIKNDFEMMELALVENIQRSNLNPMEEAEGYMYLKNKYNFSQSQIAEKISKSRSEIANKMRLLNLPKNIQLSIKNRDIEYGHARALLGIKDSFNLDMIHKRVLTKKLSVRDTEKIIRDINNKKSQNKNTIKRKISTEEKKLEIFFDSEVKIKKNSKHEGKIEVYFNSKLNLQNIMNKILNEKI
jgi:ParB family chromosome partitioning protein